MPDPRPLIPPAKINQYEGINPHLNDYLQDQGDEWTEFHMRHIVYLQNALNKDLLKKGYVAKIMPGLQIRRGDDYPRQKEPDVLILDKDPHRQPPGGTGMTSVPDTATAEMTIPEAMGMTDEEYFGALAIYQLETRSRPGEKPVAWVELLSPSNKPLAHRVGRKQESLDTDWQKYHEKRLTTLGAGIALVEIDYLNHTLPLPGLTPYHPIPKGRASKLHPDENDPDALSPHPYYIAVSNPNEITPDTPHGTTTITGFDVGMSMPEIVIPLAHGDTQPISFQGAYDETVGSPPIAEEIDYGRKPSHFAEYRPNDQDQIATRMKTILKAERENRLTDDQTQPLPLAYPVEDARLDLDRALADRSAGPGRSIDR